MRRLTPLCLLTLLCAGFLVPLTRTSLAQPPQQKPFPWKLGHPYKVHYSAQGVQLGTETFTITHVQQQGKDAYRLQSSVDLKQGTTPIWKANTALLVDAGMRPLSYKAQISAAGQQVTIDAAFRPGGVSEKVSGSQSLSRDIQLPQGVYCLDNNFTGSLALLCAALPLQPGKKVSASTFFPSNLQQLALALNVGQPEALTVGGKRVECYRCAIQLGPAQITAWVTKDGRLLKGQQGPVVYVVEE